MPTERRANYRRTAAAKATHVTTTNGSVSAGKPVPASDADKPRCTTDVPPAASTASAALRPVAVTCA